ncbi:MAG: adenosylcobinamide-phosphate synthase CbiB [Paracoccaceae bacterium]
MMFAGVMLVALLVEGALAWPHALYDRMGHPVTWLGSLIDLCDQRFNRGGDPDWLRRVAGVVVALGIIGAVWLVAMAVIWVLPGGWVGSLIAGILAWPLVATRSLYDHVKAVAVPLQRGDLDGARVAVSMIVGRDPTRLDTAGISRAALESLAESASDGVVAPLFWGVIFGLPGIAAYKAINTMDSMIGHLSPRHAAFGWAAARIDDVVNLIPARLTGLVFAAVSGGWQASWDCMRRDARKHRSPNAGWPEAALAGALAIRLSGPRVYDGGMSDDHWVNEGAPDPVALDIGRGLDLYLKAVGALALMLAVLALI